MHCRECGRELQRLDNAHLLACSGITLHEYAIRHHQPLDLLLHADQVNEADDPGAYPAALLHPGEAARATLLGLNWAGLLKETDSFVQMEGEIRRLDLLLFFAESLADYGFQFRQEFEYTPDTHRVVARNRLKVPKANLQRERAPVVEPPPEFLDTLAVLVAQVAEIHSGYLFMPFEDVRAADDCAELLLRDYGIKTVALGALPPMGKRLLRCRTPRDSAHLLDLLDSRLGAMPTARQRFHQDTPHSTVSKELVFDAAHFITDHPAKCSNLHGGRYVLEVQVSGRLDPVTGCVLDYGYLKRVVNQQVVDGFDHHTLNFAAEELAWRSSTEMLCVYIWQRLIDYLPGLSGLRLYETTQSWCDYRGPTLEQFQQQGSAEIFQPMVRPDVARRWRMICPQADTVLRAVEA